jgi:hypothetical protein
VGVFVVLGFILGKDAIENGLSVERIDQFYGGYEFLFLIIGIGILILICGLSNFWELKKRKNP